MYADLRKKKLKSYNFIYQRMSLNSLSGVLLSRKLGIPLVLEYNGSEVWVQRNWGRPLFFEKVSQWVENTNILCADYIVTISKVLRDELILRGVSQEKIICYPNGVDPEKFNPANFPESILLKKRKKLGYSKKDIIVTFIGTFGKWHGIEILAQVIKKMHDDDLQWLQDNHVKFLLVGDGACMPEVKKILSSIPNYFSLVTLTGLVPQEEAPHYLALSNIFLSPHFPPNKGESFFGSPTKLFEYMAMEKVIIASDLEQIGEALSPSIHISKIKNINNSHLSILCEPGNVDHFMSAIKYSVNRLPELKFLGSNARDKVMEKYTWTRHVEEVMRKIG